MTESKDPSKGLTRQGVLNLDVPEHYWRNCVEMTRAGLTIHPCASCGGLGWFAASSMLCPGCSKERM